MMTLIQFLTICRNRQMTRGEGWHTVITRTGKTTPGVSPVMVKQAIRACQATINLGVPPGQALAETLTRLNQRAGKGAAKDWVAGGQDTYWPPKAIPQPQSTRHASNTE